MSILKVDAIGKFDSTANAMVFDSNNNVRFTKSVQFDNKVDNRNLLINGGFDIWQYSTNATGKTTTGYYSASRWRNAIGSMGTYSYAQSTDVPSGQGLRYSLKIDCTTADASPAAGDVHILQQYMEGRELQTLLKGTSDAKSLTLSFWVKSNKTGTYIIELYDIDNTRQISKSYTINSANTWERKRLRFPADTTGTLDNDNAESLILQFWLSTGSTYSSGTLSTSWGSATNADRAVGQVNFADSTSNEIFFAGMQLEVGNRATPFEHETIQDVTAKCYRYYFADGYYQTFGGNNNDKSFSNPFYFPVAMRATPSMTNTAYDGTNNKMGRQWLGGSAINIEATYVTYQYFYYRSNSGSNAYHLNALGSFKADAELPV